MIVDVQTKQELFEAYARSKTEDILVRTHNPKVRAWASTLFSTVLYEPCEEVVSPQPIVSHEPIVFPEPIVSSEPSTHQDKICLILHCEKYASRRTKYVDNYKPILESLGFRCYFVLGAKDLSQTEVLLENEFLFTPVEEGYTRCNLKLYHAYMYVRNASPSLVLKIDDDITILDEPTFRNELQIAESYDYSVVHLTTCRNGTYYIPKRDDPSFRKGYPTKQSTYGTGGIHVLGRKALKDITYHDMTETIFEDLNMGLMAKKYGWTVHNFQWISRKITTYEEQSYK